MKSTNTNIIKRNKDIMAVFLVTALILLVPLVAMQFTEEVDWKLFDFIVMGSLLSGIGLLFVLAVRKISDTVHRVVVGILLLVALLLLWAELAVGIFGSPIAGS